MVAGLPFTAGSAALAGTIASVDDGVASLLREAGTLMIGKTNTPEFGLPCYTEPDIAPAARSPWDLSRSAGGSSGGAAAAVAAHVVPVAHGIRRRRLDPDSGQRVWPGRPEADPRAGERGTPWRRWRGAGCLRSAHPGRARHRRAARRPRLQPGRGRLCTSHTSHTIPGSVRTRSETAPDRCAPTTPVIAEQARVDRQPCLDAVNETASLLVDLGHAVEDAPVPFPAERWASFEALWSVLAAAAPVPTEKEHLLRPYTRWLRAKGRGFTASNSPKPSPAYNGRPARQRGCGLRSTSSSHRHSPGCPRSSASYATTRTRPPISQRRWNTRRGPVSGTSPACRRSACPCIGSRSTARRFRSASCSAGGTGRRPPCSRCPPNSNVPDRGATPCRRSGGDHETDLAVGPAKVSHDRDKGGEDVAEATVRVLPRSECSRSAAGDGSPGRAARVGVCRRPGPPVPAALRGHLRADVGDSGDHHVGAGFPDVANLPLNLLQCWPRLLRRWMCCPVVGSISDSERAASGTRSTATAAP